jgi:hypothetical protein
LIGIEGARRAEPGEGLAQRLDTEPRGGLGIAPERRVFRADCSSCRHGIH